MADLISLTVRSRNYKNLDTSLTMGFDATALDDLRANPNASLNGNSMFTFTQESGISVVYTVDESVATIIARGSATSVGGTTSESFSIDNDATTYFLIKNSSGTLQVRNQTDTAYAPISASYGTFYLGAAETITVDAATTDHTGTSCLTFDVDINANPCNVINQTIDIATALSNDTVRGIYTDIDDITASTNGSALIGHDVIITGVSGSFSDIYGFKVVIDGTKDGGDEAIGLVVNGDSLTINNAAEVLRGADIDFSSTTITSYVTNGFEGVKVTMPAAYHATSIASALSLSGAGSTLKALTGTTAGYTGLQLALGAGVSGIVVDAATADHTGDDNMFYADVDISDSAVVAFNALLDVTVAHTGANIVKGFNVDYDGIAANLDSSGFYGVHVTATATSTGREDIFGFYAVLDGTRDTDDLIKGFYVDGSGLTINSTSAQLHGLVIDFDSVTDTDYVTNGFEGILVTMPATYQGTDVASAVDLQGAGNTVKFISGAATIYGIDMTLSAATVGINIDAGTTDTTAANIINANVDVNSTNCNFINADIDVGTALSAGEVVKGAYLDLAEAVANANTSSLIGVDVLLTGFATSASDLYGFKATLAGTKNAGDVTRGLFIDANTTLNNASEVLYGIEVDTAGVTNTSSAALGAINLVLGASSQALIIDAGTTDHTGSNIIYANIDVNSAACNFIEADIDVGTALSAGETVNGIKIDINGDGADHATSQLNAYYTTNGGTSTGITTVLRVDGTWNTGIDLTGGTITTDVKLSNGGLIHNTSADIITFTEANLNFVGNVNISGSLNYCSSATGNDTYTATVSGIASYVAGQIFLLKADTANTGACSLNVNGLGAKAIKDLDGNDPQDNDVLTTGIAILVYDGTNLVLTNPATTAG